MDSDLQSSARQHYSEVGRLVTVGVTGQLVIFALSVAMARNLSVADFEAYVVAAALFLLMVAIAAQGLDKYALRLLPGKFDRGDWQLAADYVVFALRRVLVGALVVGLAGALWARYVREFPPGTLYAVYLACAGVPLGVLVCFLGAVLSATGDCARAAFLTLLLPPAVALLALGGAILLRLPLSGAVGIACWGVGWLVALLAVVARVQRAWSGPRRALARGVPRPGWRAAAMPFWLYRLAMGAVAHMAVILLDWLQPSAAATGAYAAAMSMAGVAAVLAVATNRVYARELSVLMERGDYTGVDRYRRQRLLWLVPVLVVFLLGAFLFTDDLLRLFRPQFVEEGRAAFRVLALSTAATVWLGVAPTYLKYQRHHRITFAVLTACAVIQLLLLVILVPGLEASGAAIAYMVSMMGMYGFLALYALRQLRARRHQEQPPQSG